MSVISKSCAKRAARTNTMATPSRHFGFALSVSTGIGGEYWRLSLADTLDEPGLREAVRSLSQTCLDPNPFFTLTILEPAIEHLGSDKVKFLCLTRHDNTTADLQFFLPVELNTSSLFGRKIMKSWTHSYGPLGTPLVNSNYGDETFNALSHCLRLAQDDQAQALVLDFLPMQSRISSGLYKNKQLSDRLLRFSPGSRAGFSSQRALKDIVKQVSGKRKQRLTTAQRKLEKLGPLEFSTAGNIEEIRIALADQLQLENEGWKGRRGTAILNHKDLLEYMSSSIANLSRISSCEIHVLKLKGIPIASMVMINSNGHFFPWKIAFDENYAKYSAGNLLLSHVNNSLLDESKFLSLDSLAGELNETANRFWSKGQDFSSMVIGFGSNATETAIKIADNGYRLEKAKRSLKRLTKRSL